MYDPDDFMSNIFYVPPTTGSADWKVPRFLPLSPTLSGASDIR
jgi:hypothetical protein